MKLIPVNEIDGVSMNNLTIWLLEGGDTIFLVPTINGALYDGTDRESCSSEVELEIRVAVEVVQQKHRSSPKQVVFYDRHISGDTRKEIEGFFHHMMIIRLKTQLRFADAKAYSDALGLEFTVTPISSL